MKLDRVIAVGNEETVYHDGDRCVRVFQGERSRAEVLMEALEMARKREAGESLPQVEEVTRMDGKWAIVMEPFEDPETTRRVMKRAEAAEKKGKKDMDITVCIGSSCHIKGAQAVVERLQELIARERLGDQVELRGAFCMGRCQQGVCVKMNDALHSVSPDQVDAFFESVVRAALPEGREGGCPAV